MSQQIVVTPNQYGKANVVTVRYEDNMIAIGERNTLVFYLVSGNTASFIIDTQNFSKLVVTGNASVTLQDYDIVAQTPVGQVMNVTYTNGESGVYLTYTHYVLVNVTFSGPGYMNIYLS